MAIKREDERYSSDPVEEISGIVEHVERKKRSATDSAEAGEADQSGEPAASDESAAPAFQMRVLGDMRDTGKKRRRG